MKKIYFIGVSLDKAGGIERVINTLANSLVSTYDVEVVSFFKNNDKSFYEYNDKILFRTIFDRFRFKSQEFINNPIKYKVLRILEKSIVRILEKKELRKLSLNFKSGDVVVFGRVPMALKMMPYINKDVTIVVREAIHIFNHNRRRLKKMIGKVDHLIVSSEENKKEYGKFLAGVDDICVTKLYNPLGIIPQRSDINSKRVITIGRYDQQKGFDVLLKAWRLVSQRKPDWELEIVGSGYYKNEMVSLINHLKISNSVILSPPTKDVVSKLKESSIFVMSSRMEGYANALVEAMICGLACVSFDWVMGIEDIIVNKMNGIIVQLQDRYKYMNYKYSNDEDIQNLSNAIIYLIENKKQREMLGIEAEKIFESREKGKIIKRWLEIINEG